jgi:DNA-binding MarR family transcriptional regulator
MERTMPTTPTTPTFSPQILGQTEKALNAILDRLLIPAGLTEPQWVALTLAVVGGESIGADQLISRVSGALKVTAAAAQAQLAELAAARLLDIPNAHGLPVNVTDAGQQLFAQIRAEVGQITQRLWGDLPEEDLAIAGRVLATILARVDGELAGTERAVPHTPR